MAGTCSVNSIHHKCFRVNDNSWIGMRSNEPCELSDDIGCFGQPVKNSVCQSCLSEQHPAYACCLARSRWRWTDGSSMDYTNWYRLEPGQTSRGLCGYMGGNDGNWYDDSCTATKLYICKRHEEVTQGTVHTILVHLLYQLQRSLSASVTYSTCIT